MTEQNRLRLSTAAADELVHLLDERGVEYEVKTEMTTGIEHIIWHPNEFSQWDWNEEFGVGWISGWQQGVTPAQAVAVTLGRGECHDLAETPAYRDKTEFKCSGCGYEYSSVGGFGCDSGDEPDFNFCPNCGRKVVDE